MKVRLTYGELKRLLEDTSVPSHANMDMSHIEKYIDSLIERYKEYNYEHLDKTYQEPVDKTTISFDPTKTPEALWQDQVELAAKEFRDEVTQIANKIQDKLIRGRYNRAAMGMFIPGKQWK